MKEKEEQQLRQLISEEINKAMMRKVLVERGPRKQGDPEKKIVEEEWNVLDWIVSYIPLIEAALRGLQEDTDKMKNKVNQNNEMTQAVGQLLINNENNLKKIAQITDKYFLEMSKTQKELLIYEGDTQ